MIFSAKIAAARRGKRVIARTIACGILLLIVPACGIPHLRRPDPAPFLPEDFNGRSSPDNSAQLGIEEFYNDPMLTCLIREALANNRELKILNEEVQVASNEVLARSGAYLPFASLGAGAGLARTSRFTVEGAGIVTDPFLPGKFFNLAHGNFETGLNFTWQLDIYRQLRNARDAAGQRYNAAHERRNYFVTRMIADIAENYYRLMALDKRLENLDFTINLQERSRENAEALKNAGRTTELAVLRFQGEIRRNQSDKLIVNQEIIEVENRINFLVNRFPMPVERVSSGFFDLIINTVNVGVPSELLRNRPDIRQAERELLAAGLDVDVARVNFYPQLVLNTGVGLESYLLNHLFEPQAVIGNVIGGLVGPLVNKRAIRAQYLTANARQLQAIYNYQRVILNAFTEVINRVTMVENYTNSLKIKVQQLEALESSVKVATDLFQLARTEYIDVLLAQRDLRDARMTLIDTKNQQLSAIVNSYQALGGGDLLAISTRVGLYGQAPYLHTVADGEDFRSIAQRYYNSDRYHKSLWAANKRVASAPDRLVLGTKIVIPPIDQLDPALIEDVPAPTSPPTEAKPDAGPTPPPPPPSPNLPGPFGRHWTRDPNVRTAGGPAAPTAPPGSTPPGR